MIYPLFKLQLSMKETMVTYKALENLQLGITYGADQLLLGRRGYNELPTHDKSLKQTYKWIMPYYKREIEPKLRIDSSVLIVAHGHSLCVMMIYLENLSAAEIYAVDIATGIRRLYKLTNELKLPKADYLARTKLCFSYNNKSENMIFKKHVFAFSGHKLSMFEPFQC